MNILAIIGKGDKRILAYPLLHNLALMGKTAVLTDDAAYSRLYSEGSTEGSLDIDFTDRKLKKRGRIHETIEITIAPSLKDVYDSFISECEIEQYDNVLVLSDAYLPNCDAYVALTSAYKDFFGKHLDEFLTYNDDKDIQGIIFTSAPQNRKEWAEQRVIPFTWTEERLLYMYRTEESRKLMPLNDKEIIAFLCDRFASTLGVTPKEFLKMSKRKL